MNEVKCKECNYYYSFYRNKKIKELCLLAIEQRDFDKPSPDWCPLKEHEKNGT